MSPIGVTRLRFGARTMARRLIVAARSHAAAVGGLHGVEGLRGGRFSDVLASMSVLEIRTYRLKPGASAAFHQAVAERSVPLLRQFEIAVVRFGPSEHNEQGVEEYVLMRSFQSMALRDEQEERFYGSKEWQRGMREEVVGMIESYHTVVLTVPDQAIQALRNGGA